MTEKYDLDKDPDYIAYMEELHAASDRDFQAICDKKAEEAYHFNRLCNSFGFIGKAI